MKRYIRASLSESMPSWLRSRLSAKRGSWEYNKFKDSLLKKYRIALDRAEFLDQPTSNSLPVYLIRDDYGNAIYAPGINDDSTVTLSGRNRKLGAISKNTLPKYVDDVVYIDLDDPNNTFEKREKYQDPRYSYRHNERGKYAGQYMKKKYMGHDEHFNSIYEDEGWSAKGMTPSNERRARDKSGYKVPSPEEMVAQYYIKFPERVTQKIDRVYNRMQYVKAELMAADFNGPNNREDRREFSRAFRWFGDAVDTYRSILDRLDESGKLKGRSYDPDYVYNEFSDSVSNINRTLNEVEKVLGL